MNSYIDYNYYSNTFGGTLIPDEEFETYGKRASQEVRIRILNRDISEYEDEVKDCTCKVAEILYNQDIIKEHYKAVVNGTDVLITSEKVGDYSRNLANLSFTDLKALVNENKLEQEISDEIDKDLLFTNLTYRGI